MTSRRRVARLGLAASIRWLQWQIILAGREDAEPTDSSCVCRVPGAHTAMEGQPTASISPEPRPAVYVCYGLQWSLIEMFYKLLELNKRAPGNGHILTELSEGEIN